VKGTFFDDDDNTTTTTMVLPKLAKRKSRSNLAKAVRVNRSKKDWFGVLDQFKTVDLGNSKGKVRTFECNKNIITAMQMALNIFVDLLKDKDSNFHVDDLYWTKIDNYVQQSFGLKSGYAQQLRKYFIDTGDVLIFGADENLEKQEQEPPNKKLTKEQAVSIVQEVDRKHGNGETVTKQEMINYVRKQYNIELSKSAITRYFRQLGLSWQNARTKKRNVGAYRMDVLREYLIKLNSYYKTYKEQQEDCDFVFAFTDESYVHRTHCRQQSWFGDASRTVNRTASKGERLILLHAITTEGPLCQRDGNNKPVDDLVWDGQTPHPDTGRGGLFTCETIWKATSAKGDYHDNMCSEMFMQWATDRLVPTFEALHPGKKMVLVLDNAPYHHKREIGALGSMTKNELVAVCEKYDVEYIDVPLNDVRLRELDKSDTIDGVTDMGDYCRVEFHPDTFKQRAGSNKPFLPSVAEMKTGVVEYFKEHKPELLDCKFERFMQERGHIILWTPPYSPDLQPIELFWAAGKNHAARFYHNNITMKEVVQHVREGWYGTIEGNNNNNNENNENNNPNILQPPAEATKKAVDCRKLFEESIKKANSIFVPLCDGISGTIGALTIDDNHIPNRQGMPIDMVVMDVTRDLAEEVEYGQ
jgi:hypothetical protein